MPEGQVLLPAEIVTADNLEEVLERQTDPDKAVEWYAAFLAENLDAVEANVVPFED
jgi:hypothetical protein